MLSLFNFFERFSWKKREAKERETINDAGVCKWRKKEEKKKKKEKEEEEEEEKVWEEAVEVSKVGCCRAGRPANKS